MIKIPYTSRLTSMNQTDQINQRDQTDEICQMWRPDHLTDRSNRSTRSTNKAGFIGQPSCWIASYRSLAEKSRLILIYLFFHLTPKLSCRQPQA